MINCSRWFVLLITFFLFFSQSIRSQSDLSKLVKIGLEQCYNFEWSEAEKTFQKVINRFPEKPHGYQYKASIYLWYYLGSNNQTDLETFTISSDLAIEKSESLLNSSPEDANIMLLIGTNYTYRAIAFTKSGNLVDAVFASKKSESFLSECIKRNPQLNDAYLGLGLYYFAMSQVPGAFKWVLQIAGMSGDRETGLDYIKITAEKGSLLKIEAQYYLSQILSEILGDYKTSSEYLKKLNRNYSNNLLFSYALAVVKIKQRDLTEAKRLLSKIIKTKNEKFSKIISFSNFLMGDIHFRNNQFSEAISYYKSFLESAPDSDYKGIANFRIATSYEILNDRSSSQKYFQLTGEGNPDIEDDIYAKRKGGIYSKRTMAENEKKIVIFGNMIEAGKFQEANDSLKKIIPLIKSQKLKSEALYLLSESSYWLGKENESYTYAMDVIKLNNTEESWVVPYCYFNIARIHKKNGRIKEMNEQIEKIEDFNDYDYFNRLENLIYSLTLGT
ncbi:MAG: DUF3808 domain-containing protein [Ignavibacteriaceae bacterium]|nr:DUF3808 domain-containing protein [Ignavibacteriaceae bacterium]